ncbi:MAG: DUF2007 domain-containing protein [Geminicoccaceae bacterium]
MANLATPRQPERTVPSMKEVVRSNDLVHLSWAQAMLAAEGIESVVLDTFTSAIEGSIGAIPRRLMVLDEDHAAAVQLLEEAARADG